jgi:hypothetical protein
MKLELPEEDLYHKYHVLKIPTEKQGELLIVGMNKARAIIKHYDAIREFVDKHREESKEGV